LNKLIEKWTVNHAAEEVMTLMQKGGVKAGVVQTVEDVVEYDPQLKLRHFFWKLNHPVVGESIHNRPPYLLSETPSELRMPPALLGQHSEFVCKELLKMSEEEYVSLLIDNVLR